MTSYDHLLNQTERHLLYNLQGGETDLLHFAGEYQFSDIFYIFSRSSPSK